MGSFTQVLRNFFKRAKKERSATDESSRGATPNSPPSNFHANDDLPPRLPAVKPSSTFTAEQPLPQIDGSSTTEQQNAAEVLPVSQQREDDSPTGVGTWQAKKLGIPRVSEQSGQVNMLPNGTSSDGIDKRHSMAVSALDKDERVEPSLKVDSAANAPAAAMSEVAAVAALPSEPTTMTTTATYTVSGAHENIDPAATVAKEGEPPVASIAKHELPNLDKVEDLGSAQFAISTADEGKIAVLDEPAPLFLGTTAALRMSATSGPLEDFPEGV